MCNESQYPIIWLHAHFLELSIGSGVVLQGCCAGRKRMPADLFVCGLIYPLRPSIAQALL
jgi:hypothetical protein